MANNKKTKSQSTNTQAINKLPPHPRRNTPNSRLSRNWRYDRRFRASQFGAASPCRVFTYEERKEWATKNGYKASK